MKRYEFNNKEIGAIHVKKINLNPLRWRVNTYALWVSFLLPGLTMLAYFAYRKMAPFGTSSILTVDLGQQYIDFFAGYRDAVLHSPTSIFYSFAKGLGGETYGDWAYYLLSPFNLLLLPFSNAKLPVGILLVTVLKYSFAGWSMAYALRSMRWQSGWQLPIFSVSYAFMGWFVANELNLLWLDAAILLPLIVMGLERYLDNQSHWRYIWGLTAIFIINYYMAYMIGIFLVVYLLWRLSWQPYSLRQRGIIFGRFVFGSVISLGLATFVWLPTAASLVNSKGQHMLSGLKNEFEYKPLDLLAKLFNGTYNFDQMQTGTANIFVGSLILIVVWFFFTYRDIRWQTRVVALLVTAFLIVSMMYAPLDVAWHGFQFPVWYPYRFSFVFSFWLIWLAGSVWSPKLTFSWPQIIGILIILIAVVAYLYQRLPKLNYLSSTQLWVGVSFFLVILAFHLLPWRGWWWLPAMLILVAGEMVFSTVGTLNNFSYLTQTEYQNLITSLESVTKTLPSKQKHFYRVAQSFQRTKGDALQGSYYGASTFTSALEHQQSDFMAIIGEPEGDNYVNYDGGTLVTDSLLGMRYLMQTTGIDATIAGTPANMAILPRDDTDGIYSSQKIINNIELSKNNQALPVAFAANTAALSVTSKENDPMTNQNRLWQALLGATDTGPITSANFEQAIGANLDAPSVVTGAFLKKKDANLGASLTLRYKADGNGPYYLTIGSGVSNHDISILVNGVQVSEIPSHRHTIILPLPNANKNAQQTITITLKKASVWLQDVSLYHLKTEVFQQQASSLQQNGLKISSATSTKITGSIKMPIGSGLLMTTIPASSGWKMYVDGREVDTIKVANFFMAAVIGPGEHTVTFKYSVPMLRYGVITTIGFILFMIGFSWSEGARKKRRVKDLTLH